MARFSDAAKFLRSVSLRWWLLSICALITLLIAYPVILWNREKDPDLPNYVNLRYYTSFSQSRQNSLETINNSTLGFGKVLAINLPERTDHRDGLVLASALSNISIEYIDGVRGTKIPVKALPPYDEALLEKPGAVGAWRAHMNAISTAVHSGWATTLILEDDVDWDIRLRSQLQDIALGAQFVAENMSKNLTTKYDARHSEMKRSLPALNDLPYGDKWDILWLGHCGMEVSEDASTMIFENDATVPRRDDIISWNGREVKYLSGFPEHSRIVTEQKCGTCSLAYAVSQRGARKLLYEVGIRKIDNPFDVMLREFCQGRDGRKPRCVSVLPPIFDHYRPAGSTAGDSDITTKRKSGSQRSEEMSINIRWSTRLNFEKLLNDEYDYHDQYPGK